MKRQKNLLQTRKAFPAFFILLSLTISGVNPLAAQEAGSSKFDWLDISGYINHDVKYDSRQAVVARDGELFLYPKAVVEDAYGEDLNGNGRLQMFNIDARMRFTMTGPEWHGFKTKGVIEGDFFGTTTVTESTLRLRHAFVQLQKDKVGIILGQTWHPAFFAECYPGVLAFGASVPLHPLNRAPQVRFTYTPSERLALSASILSERDFTSTGPAGSSGEYLRNSGVPDMQLKVIAKPTETITLGAVGGYMIIAPRIVTEANVAHKETLGSYNMSAFAKYKTEHFYFKLHGFYGQNVNRFVMLGGYAVDQITDVTNDFRTYKNINTASVWSEVEYNTNNWYFGLFGGYMALDGNADLSTAVYGLGASNVESLYRWSPRVAYKFKKLQFGLEVMATTANYMAHTDAASGIAVSAHAATSYRYLFNTMFYF